MDIVNSFLGLFKDKMSNFPHVEDEEEFNPGTMKLPGLDLPIDSFGEAEEDDRFPVLSEHDGWRAKTLLRREVCMMRAMGLLTDKAEWWRKVNDPAISDKWKKEMLDMPWGDITEFGDFTSDMADAVIAELKKKAVLYVETSLIPVVDYSATAIKSDKILEDNQELVEALKKATASLENVPEQEKDWHPGSDGKVLDLVHPSLYPLVYGRSRVVTDRRINLEEALEACGTGQQIPAQKKEFKSFSEVFSHNFQWLPCDVNIEDGKAKITSYINNLHPEEHADMYPVIEQFIEKSLPAWDLVYRWQREHQLQRLTCWDVYPECTVEFGEPDRWCNCRLSDRPLDEDEGNDRQEDEEWEDWYPGSDREKRDKPWYLSTHHVKIPNPDVNAEYCKIGPSDVKTEGFFYDSTRLQVIVKLANIHLTPEKPTYDGGSWHVEGQINEHIAATALFYYDSENISDCNLDFRSIADEEQMMMELGYPQSDDLSIRRVFAIENVDNITQDIGSVLTRPNRSLFFPNLYQHHVSPFKLVDPTKPGHRKILALFLVDPKIPIISTANVPPQQRSWWAKQVNDLKGTKLMNLPPEIRNQVEDEVKWPIGEEEAKKTRLELMEERSRLTQDAITKMAPEYNFCEH